MNRGERNYVVRSVSAEQVVKIDGKGGDPAWDRAEEMTDFSFPWKSDQPPATSFRALRNGERFYFLFEVVDADVVLGKAGDLYEQVTRSDRVEIFFTTSDSLDRYYCLEIDPRKKVHDYEARFYRQMNRGWKCAGLEVAAIRTATGYVVEGSLPLTTLRELGCVHSGESGLEELKAGVFRAEFSHGPGDEVIENWISWIDPEIEKPDFHIPGTFGVMVLEP